jgi:hypothetical protein
MGSSSPARVAVSILLAFAAFVGVGVASHDPDRLDPRSLASAKLAEFAEDKDSYEVVFVGNSRMYRHASPAVFDRRMAANGHPLRSYNLGAPNMSFPEIDYMIRRVLATRPAKLEWVVLDMTFPWQLDERNFETRRVEHWHDARALRTALDLALRTDDPERLGWRGALQHLGKFVQRFVGYGRRADDLTEPVTRDLLENHERGHVPLRTGDREARDERRQEFLDDIAEYGLRVAHTTATPPWRVRVDPLQEELLSRSIDGLHAVGVRVLTFVPPVPMALTYLDLDGAGGVGDLHLEYNDPRQFPDLFEVDRRFDVGHLSERGARAWSRDLADALAAYLDT